MKLVNCTLKILPQINEESATLDTIWQTQKNLT